MSRQSGRQKRPHSKAASTEPLSPLESFCKQNGVDPDAQVVIRPEALGVVRRFNVLSSEEHDRLYAEMGIFTGRVAGGLRRTETFKVTDPRGSRTFTTSDGCYPPIIDPVEKLLSAEARTRTRLRDGGDLYWYLRTEEDFTERSTAGGMSFGEYVTRRGWTDRVDVELDITTNAVTASDTSERGPGRPRGPAYGEEAEMESDVYITTMKTTPRKAAFKPLAEKWKRTEKDIERMFNRVRRRPKALRPTGK